MLGIEEFLTDVNGKVHGFSTYRVFLYTLLILLFFQIGWTIWLCVCKRKSYFLALLIPIILGWYQVGIVLLNLRKSPFNSLITKLFILLGLTVILSLFFLRRSKFTVRTTIKCSLIVLAVAFPFFHGIVTLNTGALREWVPVLGIENLLTGSEGTIIGFGYYRVFLYTLMLHLYAHLG